MMMNGTRSVHEFATKNVMEQEVHMKLLLGGLSFEKSFVWAKNCLPELHSGELGNRFQATILMSFIQEIYANGFQATILIVYVDDIVVT